MTDASVDLFWLPLGAGEPLGLVRRSGRGYEQLAALRDHRAVRDLYHSALEVGLGADRYVIEMAPVWSTRAPDRGVVGEGAVGLPWLGRFRLFRYEVRCWRDGVIPDLATAVGGRRRLSTDVPTTRTLLELVPAFPTATWGRDELHAGDMWNSNSLTAWLLTRCGLADAVHPPEHGRAPGWLAGCAVAAGAEPTAAAPLSSPRWKAYPRPAG